MNSPKTMTKPQIRVKKLHPNAKLPERASSRATGYDIYACLDGNDLTLTEQPMKVATGIAIEAPPEFDVQIRPRSGLSARGVMVTLGTIDPDYRGELLVTMYLLPSSPQHVIHDGDRIAQMVITRALPVDFEEADELSDTERGVGGHGSTGR